MTVSDIDRPRPAGDSPDPFTGLQALTAGMVTTLLESGVSRERLLDFVAKVPAPHPTQHDEALEEDDFEAVVTMRQARENLRLIVEQVQQHPTLLTRHGRPIAAIVSASFYTRAIEALEDLEDLRAVHDRSVEDGIKDGPEDSTEAEAFSHEQVGRDIDTGTRG